MSADALVVDGFESFTAEHYGILTLLLVGAAVLGSVGLRQRAAGADVRFRRGFAIAIPVFTVPMQVLQLLPDDFTLGTSLPLQVCDLSWMVAVYALWTRSEPASALLYFWGLTLTVQAAVTPSLAETYPDPRYFMFWGMHLLTIWAAVYLACLVGGPSWRGFRFAFVCTAVWAAVAMVFNAATGTNYGYLARKPESGSLLDLLGPWPVYVLAEVVVLAAGWALMTWPWVRAAAVPPGREVVPVSWPVDAGRPAPAHRRRAAHRGRRA
ncbi:MAG TPA: TIGR02206 family membrane protein [Marmoricola sp.]